MIDNKYKYTNSLIDEQSPYLLQHAHNPVNWRAWNDESFAIAEREDKPIFLSIGYATCHWCHVMESESFEDEEVAEILNTRFVSIKLDREERPDIDAVYMEVCQAMTGHGGWPLTILMMPDKKPFFAGTYFPKRSNFGRAGFLDILQRISSLWLENRVKIEESSTYIFNSLQEKSQQDFYLELSPDILQKTVDSFEVSFDSRYGGFRQKPKFPSPHQLCFLMRMYRRTGEVSILEMVVTTLHGMCKGGIWDHIGYGFHRYSTDEEWLVPHFEKMLYDQAWLAIAYTEAYQITKDVNFRHVAENILEYVTEKLTAPCGAFFSAEDADSDGKEGKFYVWHIEEINELLSIEDAKLFNDIYGIEHGGNFRDEATGNLTRENIPHLKISVEEYAANHNIPIELLRNKLEAVRTILHKKRNLRNHPFLDDKILADWNGMMIAAFAKAAGAFQNQSYNNNAEAAWQYIRKKMIDENGRLLHRSRNDEAAIPAFLDDYSALAYGLFELFESIGKIEYLNESNRLTDEAKLLFEDENGGFFQSEIRNEATPFSGQKQVYDGAVPSGNSMMVYNLMRLGTALQRNDYFESALKSIYSFGQQIEQYSVGFSWLLSGLEFFTGTRQEIIVHGEKENTFIQEVSKRLREEFLPSSVVIFVSVSNPLPVPIAQFNNEYTDASVFVCENYHCTLPMTTWEQFENFIQNETTVKRNVK